jgi:hypothetical protein
MSTRAFSFAASAVLCASFAKSSSSSRPRGGIGNPRVKKTQKIVKIVWVKKEKQASKIASLRHVKKRKKKSCVLSLKTY